MCFLMKLDYGKFRVSDLLFSKVIEENPAGVGSIPLLVMEGLIKINEASYKRRLSPPCSNKAFYADLNWL